MTTTIQIFETRKSEIELCYSILVDLKLEEQVRGRTLTIDEAHTERFAPILKSNILLMLYNLVEACVTTGFVEIYDSIKNNSLSYKELIESIRSIWTNYEIGRQSLAATATTITYEKKVQNIISQVISDGAIILTKDALAISGNLDARAIRQLLDSHSINITDRSEKHHVLLVKNKRNALAHGIDSFGEGARDISINQLAEIKDEVINFVNSVINYMKSYHDRQDYRIRA